MITGLVLCGGTGSRFAGLDKPLQPMAGKPLVAHVRERLQGAVAPLLVSCNRHLDDYALHADALVVDREPGLGPLGGIASSWPQVTGELLFVCPGDAPRIAVELPRRLADALDAAGGEAWAAYAHDGNRAQPLFLLLRRSAAAPLDEYLAAGGRSAHGFLATIHTVAVDCSDLAASFANVNTAADLAALEADEPASLGQQVPFSPGSVG